MKSNIKKPKDRLVLALDVDTLEDAKELVYELKNYVGTFKIGLQLFTSVGPEIIKIIHGEGANIFFDGKFHDIPNTVAKACANLVKHGVTFFDIHVAGGSKMMMTAAKLARETAKRYEQPEPTILGVTLISSFGQRTLTEELGIYANIDDYATKLAMLAKDCGLDGVMVSANDLPNIRKKCAEDFVIMCPAVRPTWSMVNDQIRILTPTDAIKAGGDYLVVGRPITQATKRISAAKMIIDEIEYALEEKEEVL